MLQTLARLLYLGESERSNKRNFEALQYYVATFRTYQGIIPIPKVYHQNYGIYLHALTVHAPAQFQLMSLKSCNAEHEERLFGQAKDIATATSNTKPDPNILLRLQPKRKDMYTSLKTA